MKKKLFQLPFKSNFFKEQDPFHLVILFFIIFFGTALFFSIPTFYNYSKYNQQIEKTINNEYKIKIHNLKDISFRFIPSPHLLIKKGDLKIREDEQELVSKLENIKIFISIIDFYRDDIFKIKRIEIKKSNFYMNTLSFKNFIYNLKKNIVNDLIITKSTFFFKDKNNQIILISKIDDLEYRFDFANKKKIFSINGNIFDSDFKFNYIINYDQPNIQKSILELKNPNLIFNNVLEEKINDPKLKQTGELTINFFNNKNSIQYDIIEKNIYFVDKEKKNSNFDLNGSIKFNPFYFDINLNLKKINLFELEKILYSFYINQESKYENLSGILKIKFESLNNKIINDGSIDLLFEDSNILSENKIFNLGDFATIEIGEYEYLDNDDQVFQMKGKINILESKKFNRFLFNYNKDRISEKNLYFTYRYNAKTKVSFISKVSSKGYLNEVEFYQFKNFQQLKNLFRDDNLFNLD